MILQNNTVLITGGGSGIGLALATRLANAGNQVIICGRRSEQLALAKNECPALVPMVADISTSGGRKLLFESVTQKFPKLNVLVNNAGIQNRPPPLTDPQDWQKHASEIATNLEAPLHLTMLFLPHLLQQKNPALINVTSGLAFAPVSWMPTYCLTKAALHSFTLSLRHQLKETACNVIELIPPAVNTDLGGKGLHDQGVNLNKFADHCLIKLAEGELEFGYESSEDRRLAVKSVVDPFFKKMNP